MLIFTEQLLKDSGCDWRFIFSKNPAPASHVESRAVASLWALTVVFSVLNGTLGQFCPISVVSEPVNLLVQGAPVVWLLIVLKKRIACVLSEDRFFGMVMLHWWAVLEAEDSRGADQSHTKPEFLRWNMGLVCAKAFARAIQQEKEHLGYPSPEGQPQKQQSPHCALSKILPCWKQSISP